MQVNRLTEDELSNPMITSELIPLGRAFIAEANHPSPFNPNHFFPVWSNAVAKNLGTFYVATDKEEPIGVLGGWFVPELFSGEMAAQESFWFVKPEARKTRAALMLLNAFESDAVERKCTSVLMVHLELPNAEGLGKLYARRGYSRCEQFYRKRI